MKTGIELIAEERARQISKEGWTPEHDAGHKSNELPRAASGYLHHAIARGWLPDPAKYRDEAAPDDWPWEEEWWKPKSPIQDYVRAAALIAAEIDRLQRLEGKSK